MRFAMLGLCLWACHVSEPTPSAKVDTAPPPSTPAPAVEAGDAGAPLAPPLDAGARVDVDGGPLESGEATRSAKAAGMKATVIVPHPVRCPVPPPPHGDPARLEAKAALTRLWVEPDGFMRADVGVGDVTSMLGGPALCNHEAKSDYMNLHLAPSRDAVHAATVETHQDELVGLVIEYVPPVVIDMTKLDARYGTSRLVPGPLDSHEAGGADYSVKNAAFEGTLMFAHKDHREPRNAWNVHQVIFRRTPTIEILPESFRSLGDLRRLVALALRPRAPAPVSFYGTLGVFDKAVADRITFRGPAPDRNVARASIEKRTRDDRDTVRAIDVAFTTPIAGNKQGIARAFDATATRDEPGTLILTVRGGEVRTQLAGGKVVSLSVRRDDP